METFTPPVAPSPDLGFAVEPRVLVTRFGDGYSQRAADGLNTMRRRYESLRWENVSQAEAAAMIAFFEARQGVEAFLWTPPDTGVQAKYRATRWAQSRRTAASFVVTASFVQEFDL